MENNMIDRFSNLSIIPALAEKAANASCFAEEDAARRALYAARIMEAMMSEDLSSIPVVSK